MTLSSIRCFLYSNPFTTQNSDCLSSANFHQAFSDSLLFCSSSNFSASALCITCSPSSSASSNKLAFGNPLSLMSSSLSSDSNKLSLSHASFSCLILDSSSLVSSFSLSFSFFPSSCLSSSSLAFASSRSCCNLCARVITFACTSSSRLMITCGMAFNSAMISGCSKNFSLLLIPATHAHTNDTYGVIVNFT